MVLPVFLRDIGDDFLTAVVLKIQVDIGHFFPFQIQETFENQFVFYRVQFGNSQAAQDDTGRCAAPHPEHYPRFPYEGNNIPDHQKVIGKLGAFHHAQFISQPFFDFVGGIGIVAREGFVTEVGKIFIGGFSRWQCYFRQVQPFKIQFQVAHFSNFVGILQRLRDIAVSFRHFIRSLQIKEIALHFHSFLVGNGGVGADAQE